MAKILSKYLENYTVQFPKLSVLQAKNRHYVIIIFNVLKVEFKLEYKYKIPL